MIDRKILGRKLKMLRLERDLSQKEVANRLYVSDVTISRAENGEL